MKTFTRLPKFEHLYEMHGFGPVSLQFEGGVFPPPEALVSNVHLVPFVGDGCVIVEVEVGGRRTWAIPGGTLQPGEHWPDAARRELLEEAGARVLSMTTCGALRGHTNAAEPWRSHLPYPDFFWIVGWAEVEIIGPPTLPPDGERVLRVECVPVEHAAARLESCGEHWAADLYRLAAVLRSNSCDSACA